MKEFFAAGGSLAHNIQHYQPRVGQLKMAEAVERVLATENLDLEAPPQVLVVEAETGIGKTLAYLLPAILSGKKIVVSTATKNLQDQILDKEIPLIEEIFERTVSAVCVKGRQNYLCLYRWFQHQSSSQLSLVKQENEDRISTWLETTQTGDRAELDWLEDSSSFWYKISSQSDQCLGNECPEQSSCFITRLRQQASQARVLIVNHHLFFSDLALKKGGYGEILPRYEAVIFDEAHHLENIATNFFGKSFSQYQLLDLIADAERIAEADLDPEKHQILRARLSGLRTRLEEFSKIFPKKRGRYALTELLDELGAAKWQEAVEHLARGIEALAVLFEESRSNSEGWNTLQRRAGELHQTLLFIGLSALEETRFVHWYERKERSIYLSATPISVADELNTYLYSTVMCTVMTSATLCISGKFDYLRRRLGLPESTELLRFPSPFDYEKRSLIYIPEKSFPETSSREYPAKSATRVQELLVASGGRALVLFTSFSAMDAMAEVLEGKLDFPLLVQGRHSRKYLLDEFKANRESVLLAVASFWEGIDVVGDSLSLVIIDKLPFEVLSDPVVQARMEALKEAGGNPFMDFQVPRAVLTLRQGVGRLMRSPKDRGVIALLDVRLFSKFYGKRFLKSLPPAPVSRALNDVEDFFTAEEVV